MQTKHIDKLEELKGYEWYHNGRGFYLDESISSKSKLVLIEKNYIDSDGEMEDRRSKFFSLKNLTELEFYGLSHEQIFYTLEYLVSDWKCNNHD